LAERDSGQAQRALDYVKAGYEPYLKKWKSEGIDLGVL
jgi:hypothetical protein